VQLVLVESLTSERVKCTGKLMTGLAERNALAVFPVARVVPPQKREQLGDVHHESRIAGAVDEGARDRSIRGQILHGPSLPSGQMVFDVVLPSTVAPYSNDTGTFWLL
jgi:hypothetical protein